MSLKMITQDWYGSRGPARRLLQLSKPLMMLRKMVNGHDSQGQIPDSYRRKRQEDLLMHLIQRALETERNQG